MPQSKMQNTSLPGLGSAQPGIGSLYPQPFSSGVSGPDEKMKESKIQKRAVEVIIVVNAAITNLRIYPPASAMISNTVDRAYQAFRAIFEDKESVIFAESEKNILVCGQLLNQRDQERPQVVDFLELLLNFKIKGVTFEKGMDKAELLTFLEIIKEKPENVEKDGGIQKVIESKKLPHIILNQKIYVATDKDRQILASLEIKDEEIIKYLMGDDHASDMKMQKIREMAKDSEWISRIFQSGMKHITGKKGVVPDSEISEDVVFMIRALDKIADRVNKENISGQAAKIIADMDIEIISAVLIQGIDELIQGGVFDQIINEIDDEKFEDVAANIKRIGDEISAGDQKYAHSDIESVRQTYKNMMNSDKGRRKRNRIEERIASEEEKIIQLRDTVGHILEWDEETFFDEKTMQSLPAVVERLFVREKSGTAEAIIDRLGDGLLNENPDIRIRASETLISIVSDLTSEERANTVRKLLDMLIRWIEYETIVTPAYEQTCAELQRLAQTMIQSGSFAECRPILAVFNNIHSGKIKKDDAIQAISGGMLGKIATEDLLDILFKEFETNKQNKRNEAGHNLSRLGTAPLDRLLETLLKSRDSAERIRVLQLISEIGDVAISVLTERIEKGGPWYFMRNLVYLMGRVGGEEQAELLEPFLVDEHPQVREEALKSIHNIGGKYRTNILLSALSMADDQMKIGIVDMLGSMKDSASVYPLLELLKSKPLITSKVRGELEEKSCVALGSIGSQEAIPALMAIREQRGLLSVRRYNPKVKMAAGKALTIIKRKQTGQE